MANKHQMCQRAETARNRRKERSNLFDALEINVSDHATFDGIDACVQYDRARFDHVGGNAVRASNTDGQDIGFSCEAGEIVSMGMADGDGGILADQHQGGWLAADVAASDDNGIAPGDRNIGVM